jgi:uncharacterized protein
MILETIVTTRGEDRDQIAPMGIRWQDALAVVSPFRPSATLDSLLRARCAVINCTDDVRVFAGCLTGRYDWPTVPAQHVACNRLADALAHAELELARVEEDPQRPRLFFREVARFSHAPFAGFNRAQAAVIEGAILVSRLHMLPREKIDAEMQYLSIAVSKTAGARELEAWGWLNEEIARFRARAKETSS